ncbi:protein ROS1A [Cocos nucifera]|nr:protein ROS1A [Cocos nucifera]
MDGSGEDQHQRKQEGPWVTPTPFSEKKTLISNNGQGIPVCNSISPELGSAAAPCGGSSSSDSRGFGYRIPEPYGSTCATSSSTAPVHGYNASSHTIPMIDPTAGFSRTPFRNIPSAFDADEKLSVAPNHFLVNGEVLMFSSFSNKDGLSDPFLPNLYFLPEEAAGMSIPMTPAKGKKIQGSAHGAVVGFFEELNSRESNQETDVLQCSAEEIADNVSLKILAPVTPDKEKRVQDCILPRVIMVGQESIDGKNNQKLSDQCSNCNSSMPTTATELGSCTQQQVEWHRQTWLPPSQQPESRKDDPGLSSKGTRRRKTRRKRYMPKVFQEGKPTKTPQPVTPKPVTPLQARKHENQTSKRSYIRKKKSLNSSDTSPDTIRENVGISSAEGTSADPRAVNGIKPVRRRLNFESEGGAANVQMESRMTNAQPRRRGRPRCTPASRSKSKAKLSQGTEMVVENFPGCMVFDLSHSLNQMLQDYAMLPKSPNSLPQSFKRGSFKETSKHVTGNANNMSNPIYGLQPKLKPGEKQVNRNEQADSILIDDDNDKTGTKRDYSHIDRAQTGWTLSRDAHFMQDNKEIKQASRWDETGSHNSYSQEMHKRIRTEELNLEYHQFMQHRSKEFASADTQKSLISDKSQSPECTWTFGHIKRPTKKRSKIPVRARKLTSTATIIDCNQLLPTPEKPPQACLEALFADNCMRMKRKRRTRKAQAHLVKIMSLNVDHENKVEPSTSSSLEQKSVGSTASGGEFQEMNLHHLQIIPIQQYPTGNHVQELPYTDPISQEIVPYVINVNDVIWKVQNLDIEGEQAHGAAEPLNALVAYGGSMIVPFEKPLDTSKKQRARAKVELDDETHRVWKLLMGKECHDEAEGSYEDKEKWWEEERQIFHGRVDLFIARMRLVQGERCFSPWKGSVVDSVVGVFLTQNVSDHLSSSAFMALASRFPIRTRSNNADPNAEKISRTEKQDGTNLASDATDWQEKGFCPDVCDQGPLEIHDADYVKESEMASSNESIGSNARGNKVDDSKGVGLDIHVREPEIGLGTPHYTIDTLVAVTGSTESEDRQSLEDVVSSQNSVTSPGNSLDYPTQITNRVGSSSGPHSGANLFTGSASIGLGNSALLEENVCMAETTQRQEMDKHGNDRVLLEENCSGYDKEACKEGENSTKISYGLNNLESACRLVSYAPDSHLKCSEHNTSGVLSVRSAPSSSDNLYFKSVGMENINVVREQRISNLSFTASGTIKTNNIKCCNPSSENTNNSAGEQSALLSKITEAVDSCACISRNSLQSQTCSRADQDRANFQQEDFPNKNTQHVVDDQAQIQYMQEHQTCLNSCNHEMETLETAKTIESNSKDEVCSSQNVSTETAKSTLRAKKAKIQTEKAETFDWDSLRRQAYCDGYQRERSNESMDSLDWEAVRCAMVNEISEAIRERGMNNVLAGRIKDFLNRLVKDHGSIDLEWLRDIPPDKAKDYLLSIRGLGLKSVECVRLLALHHLAFPVDTNVGRICVRLGWVPLQPLPESLQLHLLEMYPMMATIQKFLWPRLCKLNQETLYELHYQMITFGKVFCTKSKPNCTACPMRGECKHFASAACARCRLPGLEEKSIVSSTIPLDNIHIFHPALLPQPEESNFAQGVTANNCEPVIEEPASPEPAAMENLETDNDDAFYEDPDVIPTVKINFEEFQRNLQNYIQDYNIELQEGDITKAIVAITEKADSIPMPKLKNVSRLRTEHQVYVIPDSHPILEGLEQRQPDDQFPYLLTIWTPGETAVSTEPPETCCNSQGTGELCDNKQCFACSCRQEEQAQTIRGTILIPCRTAMRGRFPLNGTYFQKNEVFADHETSISPIHVPRKWIWNLPRRTVYFGTSVTSIVRGLTTEEIQQCFKRGNICVRGFERKTRAPRPLCARLHFPASKVPRNKKTPVKEAI